MWNLILDPVEGFLVDAAGNRLGYSAGTGPLAEIPESIWFGQSDGIGWVFGPIVGEPVLQLMGLGGPIYAQVNFLRSGADWAMTVTGAIAAGESAAFSVDGPRIAGGGRADAVGTPGSAVLLLVTSAAPADPGRPPVVGAAASSIEAQAGAADPQAAAVAARRGLSNGGLELVIDAILAGMSDDEIVVLLAEACPTIEPEHARDMVRALREAIAGRPHMAPRQRDPEGSDPDEAGVRHSVLGGVLTCADYTELRRHGADGDLTAVATALGEPARPAVALAPVLETGMLAALARTVWALVGRLRCRRRRLPSGRDLPGPNPCNDDRAANGVHAIAADTLLAEHAEAPRAWEAVDDIVAILAEEHHRASALRGITVAGR